ncbi:MAG: TIGR02147 family protein [Bacteriovoracaceae bacterium]
MVSVFDYLNYLDFIRDYSESLPKSGRGFRKLLSEHLSCQISFISHVLSGDKDLSAEQAFKASELFSFSDIEREYFMNLHGYNRAGTHELKNFYLERLDGLKSKNNASLKQEMSSQVLSFVDQAIYFSEWFYSATILTRGSTLLKLSIKS